MAHTRRVESKRSEYSHLPINIDEAARLGLHQLDVIFVTGDAYIDHPSFGVPLLARWLEAHGFSVGIIPQPDWRSKDPFTVLGRPRLFFGVTSGAMDSMVAHYTPRKKLRHDDAYTPGGKHGSRPNRASIIYTSRLKEAYHDVPVVLGGIEASLRRLAHYDYWDDKVRRSILIDAKADLLIYGMAESSLLELAVRMRNGIPLSSIRDIRGTVFAGKEINQLTDVVRLPSFEEVSKDKELYLKAFRTTEQEQNPYCAARLAQSSGDRTVVCNPPSLPLTEKELDAIYSLPFTREPHTSYKEQIPAFGQIQLSLTSHRGCFGGCSFCAIGSHQGKFIQSRSVKSVTAELRLLADKSWFRGTVSDLGGPTANMYGTGCGASDGGKSCRRTSCLYPDICKNLDRDDRKLTNLLNNASRSPGVRNISISSGIRYDLLEFQQDYSNLLISKHTGGLLKVAPEHLVDSVVALMRKPGKAAFLRFIKHFREKSRQLGLRQSVIPYLMSGHPGCTLEEMALLAIELRRLGLRVEQVQEFTPTPGTASTCMYYTGIDPYTGKPVYVARTDREKILQKSLLLLHLPEERQRVFKSLNEQGRSDLLKLLDAVKGGTVDSHKKKLKTAR